MSNERVFGYPSPEVMALVRIDEMLESVRLGTTNAHLSKYIPGKGVHTVGGFEEADCALGSLLVSDHNEYPVNHHFADQVDYIGYLFRGEPLQYGDIRAMFVRALWKDGEWPEHRTFAVHTDGSITAEDIYEMPQSESMPVPEDLKLEFLRHLQHGVYN